MTRKNKKTKEEICEDHCFLCKDGGLLIICDYKDCLKAYHLECAGKDETFVDSGERWSCRWHYCFLCQKVAKFSCFCCPRAVCGQCIYDAEFVIVRGSRGFCAQCLNLALLIENGSPADSDGETVNFKDETTHEYFFKGYWDSIRTKEGLTKECVSSAKNLLKRGKNYRCDSYFHETGRIDENIGESEEESHVLVSDYDDREDVDGFKSLKKRSKSKRKVCGVNRKEKLKEFIGWGSKSLLQFLASINKDSGKPLAEYEVVSIIMEYCKENKLFHPEKRKKIVCDETLRALFGRKFLLKNSLSKLLSAHFASNIEDSTGDRIWSSSSDDTEVKYKRKKLQDSPRQPQKKEIPDVRKSCFAAVNTENIKLVYLKRGLVEELSKQPESFSDKVLGSFVRVKCNPNDYLQKNSHQLLQVKGVTTSKDGHILLQFFNSPEEFPIYKLSDDNFTEEEREDLHNKIKDGLLKKPIIVEVEQKARILHEDITNHWILKELAFLHKRIDQANEKGWRREMSEYMDRVQLLNNPSERSRLLNELPEIIAETEELEPGVQDLKKDDRDGHIGSPDTALMGASPQSSYLDWGSGIYSDQSETGDQETQSGRSVDEKLPQQSHIVPSEAGESILVRESNQSDIKTIGSFSKELFPGKLQEKHLPITSEGQTNVDISKELQSTSTTIIGEEITKPSTSEVEPIELSDDEPENKVGTTRQPVQDSVDLETRDQRDQHKGSTFEESQKTPSSVLLDSSYNKQDCRVKIGVEPIEDSGSSLWYCVSSLGHRKGPVRLSALKMSYDTMERQVGIKVWKKGDKEETAIPLEDVIRKLFS